MKSKKPLLFFSVIIILLVAIYVGLGVFFSSHFFFRSTVNGINAGGKNAAAVYSLIQKQSSEYSVSLVHNDGSVDKTINSLDIDFSVDYVVADVADLLKLQNGFMWPKALLEPATYETKKSNSFNEAALSGLISTLTFKEDANAKDSMDAYIEYDPKSLEFVIRDEVIGDKIDASSVEDAVITAIENFEEEVNLDDGSCYKKPEILSDDEKLVKALKTVNGYLNQTTTYDLGVATETVDKARKATWIKIDGTEVSIDEDAIGEFVNEMGQKYNTFGKSKHFVTSTGEEINVKPGSLGWKIAYQGEIDAIKEDMKNGEDVTRDFTYLYTAASHGENDYGDSYVEVNLTDQHVYIYKNGEMVFDTPCVTGNVYANHDTHEGAYPIAYKAKNATLRGADYTSFVNYWMPFNNGEGLHDATWRSNFGGNIYQGGGSHGCVNLPLSAAKTIYETVDEGWPVLVFYTGNTAAEIDAVRFPYVNAMSLIASIETVSLDSAGKIAEARAAYNALTEDQKVQVTNYDTLVQAEHVLWCLQMGIEPF